MSILFRYIFRENLKILGWIFSLLVILCFLIDFFDRWDDLLEHQVPTSVGLYYMLCRMPQFVLYVIPVSMLLSSFITLGLLSRRNELIALKASGASGIMIAKPLLVTSGFLCFVSFFWAEALVPAATREANRIWMIEVKKTPQRSIVSRSQLWLRIPSDEGVNFYRIGFLGTETQARNVMGGKATTINMNDVSILTVNRDFRLTRRIDTRQMTWEDGKWVLLDGLIWSASVSDGAMPRVERFERREISLPETPDDFQWVREEVESMGFFELLAYVQRAAREGFDVRAQMTELHFKMASSLFSLIVALFTIPLAMRIPPRAGGLATGIVLSMAVGFLYYLVLALGLALGKGGALPPFIGAWAANILFGTIGGWWLLHMRQ